jgi:hypothetical protein
MTRYTLSTIIGTVAVLIACTGANAKPDETSHDGLVLSPKTKFGEVTMKPDADLSQYQQVGLQACTVSFRKNWERDQNRNRVDLSNRVTQKDVDRIKDSMAESCDQIFREELLKDPAYTIVDQFEDGENVLLLRPAIIDLDINAPDVRSAGMSRSYTTSAGRMTLYLELFDATTGDILARVVDKVRGMDSGHMQWTTSVSNKADAERAMRRWAKLLRQGLDEAHSVQVEQ